MKMRYLKKIFYLPYRLIYPFVVLYWGLKKISRERYFLVLSDDYSNRIEIKCSSLGFYADPFLVEKEGVLYIFFEELRYLRNQAHISCVEVLHENGRYKISVPRKVLKKRYHLSYPFIIQKDDTYYMIPESNENNTIDLYKCTEFPFNWEHEIHLITNIQAVDTTLLYHMDRYWMFTSVYDPESETFVLNIFHSPALNCQDWTPHPINDKRLYANQPNGTGRCAGNIYQKDGKLIRPSQHSKNFYGESIVLKEITLLNEQEFVEIDLEFIKSPYLNTGTHHIAHSGKYTILDIRDKF